MFYRIVNAPPGYSPAEKYMVCAYENRDLESKAFNVAKSDGTMFAATLEDARKMIPGGATRVLYAPDELTIELWEK